MPNIKDLKPGVVLVWRHTDAKKTVIGDEYIIITDGPLKDKSHHNIRFFNTVITFQYTQRRLHPICDSNIKFTPFHKAPFYLTPDNIKMLKTDVRLVPDGSLKEELLKTAVAEAL